jgi:hypothetical protein
MYSFGSTALRPIMGDTSECDVSWIDEVKQIVAEKTEFGNIIVS